MKNVAITGPRQCEILDVPEPRIVGNYAKIEVRVVPICTEFHQYEEGHRWWKDLGHEATGVVLEAPATSRIRPGQRVVVIPQNGCGECGLCLSGNHVRCQNPVDVTARTGIETGRATYAERMIQQDWLLLPIPDDLSLVHASMAGCGLGPTFGAMQEMGVNALDTVLVSGLGPQGLGAVINGVVRGARVIGIEANPYRVAMAKSLGAEEVLDPRDPDLIQRVRDMTAGHGADKSIECSSAEGAPNVLLHATRIGGQMASVGWGGPVRLADIVRRGVTVHGIWIWRHERDAEAMWTTIRKAGPLLDRLITHSFALDEVQQAWDLQLTGQCGKVVLFPHGRPE